MKPVNKLLIIANSTWSLYNFRFNLVNELSQKYKVKILSNKDKYKDYFIKNNILFEQIIFERKTTNFFINFLLSLNLLIKIIKYKPKFILSFGLKPNLFAIIICKLLTITNISTFTGLGTLYLKKNLIQKLIIFILRIFVNKKDIIFFHNKEDVKVFQKWKIVKKNFLLTKGSGVNFNKFKSQTYLDYDDKITFIMISRLIKDKGIYEYINAAKLIKEEFKNKITFILIGNIDFGNYSSIGQDELNSWKINNIIKHYEFRNDINKYILNSHCLVLPSYREGASKIVMEAQALSRPIITTDAPGCKDLVKNDYNGYVCKVKNHIDLYDKMKKFIDLTIEKKMIMSKNAYLFAINNFNEKNVINKYLKTLKNYEK